MWEHRISGVLPPLFLFVLTKRYSEDRKLYTAEVSHVPAVTNALLRRVVRV